MSEKKIALVTGGNKGIGFEICRKLAQNGIKVILTARNEEKGEKACQKLQEENLDVLFHQLDVTDPDSIKMIVDYIKKEFERLDILINNAAVRYDRDLSIMDLDLNTIKETIEINLYGPLLMCQAFVPTVKKSNSGRIVNVSSDLGSFARMAKGSPSYRLSKAGLNALTCILADELKDTGILVNAVHPGWVRTEMGTQVAERSIEEGADTPVWAALLPDDGPSGKFFSDRKLHPW